ncbi:uncharacterized protein MYCGRDRAFT_62361 [Zymoseptoria tritici IPO323]|uniref:Uncharacterized protein n=1 Tax=Zymoseptoria tritici (strain CBS 115943 / IPO323) TaxID=336722 RepID=F9XK07_ZYMTI|nr:uncharacterized protein MYCGRDRAFT_62361 [Zymoseptoria tritici IPO323]EGP84704.1 hypothetical protein MYCGRDRAFT_62361 [Zymoseptoria tritici IPO323]
MNAGAYFWIRAKTAARRAGFSRKSAADSSARKAALGKAERRQEVSIAWTAKSPIVTGEKSDLESVPVEREVFWRLEVRVAECWTARRAVWRWLE